MPSLLADALNDPLSQTREAMRVLAERKREALRLYEPQSAQEAFHASLASERILRGGNRSGKSMGAFAETARAATGQDPHHKYPTHRPLLIWLILFNEAYIGRTAHRMLFRPGAFRIIFDHETHQWRAFRPWLKEDQERIKEARPAPPLIPPRFVGPKGFAWRRSKELVFASVELRLGPDHPMNGTRIYAFSSDAKPPMSDPVDLIHIDEDIQGGDWYLSELEARLSDTKGRLIWSVFPHSKNRALARLSSNAREQASSAKPDVAEFRLTFSGNPHIDQDEKRKRLAVWGDEERKARDLGEFLFDAVLCYPEFSPATHGVPKEAGDAAFGKLDQAILDARKLGKVVPADWTKFMILDPGHTVTAGLFLAVPPPAIGDFVVAYDEIYLRRTNAAEFAAEMEKRMAGQWFRAFLIDDHQGRKTESSGRTVKQQYSDELRSRRIVSEVTGSSFLAGSDDIPGRMTAVHSLLAIRQDGSTKFRYISGRLPNMEREFALYQKRIMKDQARDEPIRADNDLMNDLEYAAHYIGLRYYVPVRPERDISAVVKKFREWRDMDSKKRRAVGGSVFLGPGRPGSPLFTRSVAR
jgi:hypothetical protein